MTSFKPIIEYVSKELVQRKYMYNGKMSKNQCFLLINSKSENNSLEIGVIDSIISLVTSDPITNASLISI